MPAPRKRNERASLPWVDIAPGLPWANAVPSWHEQARCAEVDPELFFPEKGDSAAPAKKICFSCEVRVTCLTGALDSGEQWGVLGGKTERERRKLRHNPDLRAEALAEAELAEAS